MSTEHNHAKNRVGYEWVDVATAAAQLPYSFWLDLGVYPNELNPEVKVRVPVRRVELTVLADENAQTDQLLEAVRAVTGVRYARDLQRFCWICKKPDHYTTEHEVEITA